MILKAEKEHLKVLTELALKMWKNHSFAELEEEFKELLSKDTVQFFLKYENTLPVGFAQCQLRTDYVEGTTTSPVGYLEGIFITDSCRHKGYAKELLTACEKWAKEKGCSEFASDCELDNHVSLAFHKAMGFSEANRIICFTKTI